MRKINALKIDLLQRGNISVTESLLNKIFIYSGVNIQLSEGEEDNLYFLISHNLFLKNKMNCKSIFQGFMSVRSE